MKLSKNFNLSEFVVSNTASRKGINNTPNAAVIKNIQESVDNLFQPVRDALDKAMIINSGYRCPKLNEAVGGATSSAHKYGYAIDFICPSFGTPQQIVNFLSKFLKSNNIKFDQCIVEFNSWVHLSWKSSKGEQHCQVFAINE
ncbi:MAG: peptidase M15 [Bacteriophage sp.]|nr:MAG: peptidase M15 [Bacteriophage sp.]